MSAALTDLLARLEAAEGADRELDRLLWKATGQGSIRLVTGISMMGGRTPGPRQAFDASGNKVTIPRYTASLDAVIALAKRLGFYIRSEPFFHIDGERVDFVSWALLPRWGYWTPMDDEWFDRGEARHADQVLSAVCALVKALIAKEGQS